MTQRLCFYDSNPMTVEIPAWAPGGLEAFLVLLEYTDM